MIFVKYFFVCYSKHGDNMSTKNYSVINCTSFRSRLLGFMFQKNIKNGLCFPRCNSIHTFFMRVPILVIITNKKHEILYQKIVKPWRIVRPVKHGYYTYEFPVDYSPNRKNNIFKIS